MDGMAKAGQFSLLSLLIVTALVGAALGLARIILPAAAELGPGDLSLFKWIGLLLAFAAVVGGLYVYANR
jgi:hypothetical protein